MNFVPVDAATTAAAFLAREWNDRCSIATTSHVVTVQSGDTSFQFFVFEAMSADGSYWYIGATRWGHRCYSFTKDLAELRHDAHRVADDNERRRNELAEDL